MTFKEYIPSRPVHAEPPRNPLREIRLLPFLRGDAYVNPLHDLLSAFSRSAGRKDIPVRSPGGRVVFGRKKLTVAGGGAQVDGSYEYADLEDLKLNFAFDFTQPGRDYLAGPTYLRLLVLTFTAGDRQRMFRLQCSETKFRKLIARLYNHRVRFREFHQGVRSFKLATNIPYRRVQQLKKEYGIEW